MSSLTKEQLDRIEANRKLALQRRNERLKLQNQVPSSQEGRSRPTSTVSQAITASPFRSDGHAVHTLGAPIMHSFFSSTNTGIKKKVDTVHYANKFPSKANTNTSGDRIVTGSCQLIARDRFVVNVPYQAQLIDIFKSINSKTYDAKDKLWSFSISDYSLLMRRIQDLQGMVSISGLPHYVLEIFSKGSDDTEKNRDLDLSRIDKTLLDSLMPFQREGVCFGISKKGHCLLADDMGLGKTIQALGISHYYQEDWPLLIVCPSSVRYLWMDAILTWLPTVPYHSIQVMTTSKEYIGDAQILITSYDLMSRCVHEIQEVGFKTFIMDESHFLKSSKSARTKAAVSLLKKAKRIMMLSGTPALSRPIELFPQISAINPKLFPSFFEFGIRYCNGTKNNFGWDFSGSSNMEELQLLLESKLMIRRLKSEVITQLPPKVRQMVILNPELVHCKSKEMKQCVKNLEQEKMTAMERRGALLTYYCATGKAKLKAIQDYISDLLDSEKKFICFAHHKVVMDGICETIIGKKKEYIRIDGNTKTNDRKILCDNFQFEEKFAAAVLSITAANAGITLTAAHLVVFAELYWNPGILTQAEDRAHRIGQDDSVLVQYLVAKGTSDDHMWPMIQDKLNVLNKAGLSKDNFMHTESTVTQKSKNQPSILNYFQDISCLLDEEMDNQLLVDIELDETAVQEKKPKLSEEQK